MTNAQHRELKTLLTTIARAIPLEASSDAMRILLYRAQTLVDNQAVVVRDAPSAADSIAWMIEPTTGRLRGGADCRTKDVQLRSSVRTCCDPAPFPCSRSQTEMRS
jgi:hypothetical protein